MILLNDPKLVLDGGMINCIPESGNKYMFSKVAYLEWYADFHSIHDDLTDFGKEVYKALSSTRLNSEKLKRVDRLLDRVVENPNSSWF